MQSENPIVREAMVLVARGVKDPVVTQALIGALDDPSKLVRLRAVESLAVHEDMDAVPALIQKLSDKDADVRTAAIDALGFLQDDRAVPALLELVEAAVAQERVRLVLNALWALGNIGDHQAIASLSRLRDHSDPYVVFNAESALRKLPASPPPVKTN